eukprot:246146-Pleurochrysis_carterae.AAC.2
MQRCGGVDTRLAERDAGGRHAGYNGLSIAVSSSREVEDRRGFPGAAQQASAAREPQARTMCAA